MRGKARRSSRPSTPKPAARSRRKCNKSVVASASSRARCDGRWSSRNRAANVPSRQSGTSSRINRRANGNVSMTGLVISGSPRRTSALLMNDMSKPTLWPTTTASPRNSTIAGRTESIAGARPTIDSVIPVRTVIIGGIARPGLTSVCRVPRNSPARTFTIPISVMRSVFRSPPVVSMSSTQNVTSERGVPRSSNDRCPPAAVRIGLVDHEHAFGVKNACSMATVPGGESQIGTVVRVSADPVAELPDEALRSALEFAVGEGAVWAKMRPPQPFPADLKRFLKFQKLPAAALAQVRAAVEGDTDFRQRLGSVATTELLDEVSVLWLSRPDGWQQAIVEALPEQAGDAQAALRREERRRMAAQEAAIRTRAELLTARAELERERAARAVVLAEGERLRADLEELRRRLRESQRGQHATAQALAKAEAELLAAGRQSTDVAPPPPVPPATGLDVATVRKLLDGAVSATADIARMLGDALDE